MDLGPEFTLYTSSKTEHGQNSRFQVKSSLEEHSLSIDLRDPPDKILTNMKIIHTYIQETRQQKFRIITNVKCKYRSQRHTRHIYIKCKYKSQRLSETYIYRHQVLKNMLSRIKEIKVIIGNKCRKQNT